MSSLQTGDASSNISRSNPVYPLPLDDTVVNNNSRFPDDNRHSSSPPRSSVQQSYRHSISIMEHESMPEEFSSHHHRYSFSGWGSSHHLPSKVQKHHHPRSYHEIACSESLEIAPVASNKGSSKTLLLHGNLDIWVHGAKNLPNMDVFHKTFGVMFNKFPRHVEGKITSDPYVIISVSNAVIGRTFVINNCENPEWMQHFNVPIAHYAVEVHFVVKDSDIVGSQFIGNVSIPVELIYSGTKVEGTYPILNASGRPCKHGASLTLSIQYIPIGKLNHHYQGVGTGPDYTGVPDTYFPLRKGGTVTLYQDAHVPENLLPHVMLDRGKYRVHGKAWHDIFNAIRQARRLIYITGWSVWHKVRLVRDGGYPINYTLGDLLRSRSQEGVRVLLLIWDDPTSRNILGYKTVSKLTFVVIV